MHIAAYNNKTVYMDVNDHLPVEVALTSAGVRFPLPFGPLASCGQHLPLPAHWPLAQAQEVPLRALEDGLHCQLLMTRRWQR